MRRRLRQLWLWIRFGNITSRVVCTADSYTPGEVEYTGRGGKVIGYWAYGSYDPSYPYQGE